MFKFKLEYSNELEYPIQIRISQLHDFQMDAPNVPEIQNECWENYIQGFSGGKGCVTNITFKAFTLASNPCTLHLQTHLWYTSTTTHVTNFCQPCH